jgi:hypothetical protein
MPFMKEWLAAKRGGTKLLSFAPVSCAFHFTVILIPGIRMAVEWLLQTLSPSLHLLIHSSAWLHLGGTMEAGVERGRPCAPGRLAITISSGVHDAPPVIEAARVKDAWFEGFLRLQVWSFCSRSSATSR